MGGAQKGVITETRPMYCSQLCNDIAMQRILMMQLQQPAVGEWSRVEDQSNASSPAGSLSSSSLLNVLIERRAHHSPQNGTITLIHHCHCH